MADEELKAFRRSLMYENPCGPCLEDSLDVEAVSYCGICEKQFCVSCSRMHSKIFREHEKEDSFINKTWPPAHNYQKEPVKLRRECNIQLLKEDKEKCHVISCSFLSDGLVLLVDNFNRRLKLLSEDKSVLNTLSLPEKPHVACVVDKKVALTMANQSVLLLTVDRQNIKIVSVCPMEHECHCIAHFKETLYVGDDQTIYKYPMNCENNKIFYSNKSCHKSVKYFIINNEGTRMYVTNEVSGQVIILNMEGINLEAIRHNDMQSPRGLCFGNNCIYVCGYQSSTIIKISLTGDEPVCCFNKDDGIVSPVAICHDTNKDELVISQWRNNNVVVFELMHPSDDVNNTLADLMI
ncbi:hypothetical protein ACF0H5_019608 [Mactra antiquata]